MANMQKDVNEIISFDVWLMIIDFGIEEYKLVRSINRLVRDYTNERIVFYMNKYPPNLKIQWELIYYKMRFPEISEKWSYYDYIYKIYNPLNFKFTQALSRGVRVESHNRVLGGGVGDYISKIPQKLNKINKKRNKISQKQNKINFTKNKLRLKN